MKKDIKEYAQLSPEERQTIPTVKVAQAMLVKEHNKVPVFTKTTTPRQTMAYLREHCGVLLYQLLVVSLKSIVNLYHVISEKNKWEDVDQITTSELEKFGVVTGINDQLNLKKRVKMAFASKETFDLLMKVGCY